MAVSREPVFYDQYSDSLLWERNRKHDSSQVIMALATVAPVLRPQPAGLVLAGPASGVGPPTFRRLNAAELLTPGGTSNYFRADGQWATPAGTGVIATDLTLIDRTATALTVASSSGTDAVLPAATVALAGLMPAAAAAKLDGIEAGATRNLPDATLLSRSNHTGTQPASTITGLAASATSDTTNAANISSGTMAVARLPLFAGAAPGLVPTSTGASQLAPGQFMRSDGLWRSPLAGLSGTAPIVVTLGADEAGTAELSVATATTTSPGVLRQATAAQISALYAPTGTPAAGDATAAVTLAAAQGQLMPFNQSLLPTLNPALDTDTVPVGRGSRSYRVTLSSLADPLLRYQQPGAGSVSRLVIERIKEFCSLNDYLDLQFALDSQNLIQVPAGDFTLAKEILRPRSNISLVGAGVGVTRFLCLPNHRGHAFNLRGISDCTFQGFSLNGNAAGRGLTTTSGANNFQVQGGRNKFTDLDVFDAPNAGILLDGKHGIATFSHEIRGCFLRDNGGNGVSQAGAVLGRITNNNFRNNGYENLTIDLGSHGTIATGNHFFIHRGGCGNVGWDDSNGSLFAGNFIDSEFTTSPSLDNCNGVCINSEAGTTSGAVIVNNVILNNRGRGIWLRNRTGQPNPPGNPWWNPSKPGDAMIAGNYIRSSGIVDLQVDDTNEYVAIGNNNYQKLSILDPDAHNVRLPSGDAFIELGTSSPLIFPVNQWTQIRFDEQFANRNCSHDGNGNISIPCGGIYAITAKIRITFRNTADRVRWIQLKILGPGFERINNIEFAYETDFDDYELGISFHHLMPKGSLSAFLLPAGNSGHVTTTPSPANWLSITNL